MDPWPLAIPGRLCIGAFLLDRGDSYGFGKLLLVVFVLEPAPPGDPFYDPTPIFACNGYVW